MGNTWACIRQVKEVPVLSDSKMAGSSSVRMMANRTGSVEQQIEHSRFHWSQLAELQSNLSEEETLADNREVFKTLQMHPTWGRFFSTFGDGRSLRRDMNYAGELVVGEKFAEGGQAEVYDAQVKWDDEVLNDYDLKEGVKWALKVFKKGTLLRHLQSQWPHGYLQFHKERGALSKLTKQGTEYICNAGVRSFCDVYRATLLTDGRFAFLMVREDEDLRSHIDHQMTLITSQGSGPFSGPFSKRVAKRIMYDVAMGMDWLHRHNIVHRDLKAANVLLAKYNGWIECVVADFECSVGVIGTGFWRAPEILQACKDHNVSQREDVFTKEADVYSYGMTCYEIITGKLPFERHPLNDYDLVLNGERPEVPKYVDDWARELLSRCWESDPKARPSFGEIVNLLEPSFGDLVENIGSMLRFHLVSAFQRKC